MSIQEWGAISEMVGAIAIIVSLIYVGVQIRQSTQATRVMTSQAFVESHCGCHHADYPVSGILGCVLAWVEWVVKLARG